MLYLRYLGTGISLRPINGKPIIFVKVSPPGNYGHNKLYYVLRQKMIYEHCSSLTFFYLMSSSTGYTIQIHSFYFLFPLCSVDIFENKSKSVNILFCCFISVLLKSITALGFHIRTRIQLSYRAQPIFLRYSYCNSFMNTGFKFLHHLFIFTSSADLHKLSAILNIRHRTL